MIKEPAFFDLDFAVIFPEFASVEAAFTLGSAAITYMIESRRMGVPMVLAICGVITNFTDESDFSAILAARRQIKGWR